MDKRKTFQDSEILNLASKETTPFYLYDECEIRRRCKSLLEAFSWAPGFTNYFAVKANPNPSILKIVKEQGFGVDCSSFCELQLAKHCGFIGSEIFFTSNNTQTADFAAAMTLDALINIDDVNHIETIRETNIPFPKFLSFRYNPGPFAAPSGNPIIGSPENSKFGMTKTQIFEGIVLARSLGVVSFGLHTMLVSNCCSAHQVFLNCKLLLDLAVEVFERLGVSIDTLNFGGGIGIPYKPSDVEFDLRRLSEMLESYYEELKNTGKLDVKKLVFECGRYVTGSAGVLVTTVLHKKTTFKNFLGVDASIANLMRPMLYGAYHHISVVRDSPCSSSEGFAEHDDHHSKDGSDIYEDSSCVFDVVGSLCENNDKLAENRHLGRVNPGDILAIHDVGAHAHSMGFNYNGKLRCAEFLKSINQPQKCTFVKIRRAEETSDYFATLDI